MHANFHVWFAPPCCFYWFFLLPRLLFRLDFIIILAENTTLDASRATIHAYTIPWDIQIKVIKCFKNAVAYILHAICYKNFHFLIWPSCTVHDRRRTQKTLIANFLCLYGFSLNGTTVHSLLLYHGLQCVPNHLCRRISNNIVLQRMENITHLHTHTHIPIRLRINVYLRAKRSIWNVWKNEAMRNFGDYELLKCPNN